jgi:hypothetical protein
MAYLIPNLDFNFKKTKPFWQASVEEFLSRSVEYRQLIQRVISNIV